MKRTSVALILTLILGAMLLALLTSFLLYEYYDFVIPIRPGGTWGLAIGFIFSWTLYLSLRSRFPRVLKSKDEVTVLRAKNPLPQIIAARVAVLALAISRTAALLIGIYAGIGFWAVLKIQVDYIRTIAQLSLISGILALLILVAGLLLERLCSPPSIDGVIDSKQTT
ncbi:MAG: DUF3180 family protein [Candidatus Nanopelagicales bacterium]